MFTLFKTHNTILRANFYCNNTELFQNLYLPNHFNLKIIIFNYWNMPFFEEVLEK